MGAHIIKPSGYHGYYIILRINSDSPWLLLWDEGSDMHNTPSNSSWRL